MEAVHAALRHAFKILPGDRNVRLVAHEPHRFACPRGKSPISFRVPKEVLASPCSGLSGRSAALVWCRPCLDRTVGVSAYPDAGRALTAAAARTAHRAILPPNRGGVSRCRAF
jgi:hypothetical protein